MGVLRGREGRSQESRQSQTDRLMCHAEETILLQAGRSLWPSTVRGVGPERHRVTTLTSAQQLVWTPSDS